MAGLFKIASQISTPLALSGFLAAAFFLVVRQIIAKNIFPVLTRQISATILKLVIDRLFILSLAAMVLGFAGFALTAVLKARPIDTGKLEIGQFVVGADAKGKVLEVLVNNTTIHDVVLSKFVYSRGPSTQEMAMITMCCLYCMEAWYSVQSGRPLTISTPGSRIQQAISFVRTEDSDRSFAGRILYAPGCKGLLFAQMELNISVVAAARRVTKLGVLFPDKADKKSDNSSIVKYSATALLANKDQVCVFLGTANDPLSFRACRSEADVGPRFF